MKAKKQLDPVIEKKMMDQVNRWAKVADNARYLSVEHRHKEKEYGIKWRTTFKIELEKEYDKLVMKFGNPIEGSPTWDGDQFEVIAAIVEKDFRDVQTFYGGKQHDLLDMLSANLIAYEETCAHLRGYLKRPELHNELPPPTPPHEIKVIPKK